jgi:sugar/nucleoside kinase (ribokinase family)
VARYLTIGMLLVEDVVLPDGSQALGRLGGDALYAAIGARAFADDVQMVVRLGRGFPAELTAELEWAGLDAGLVPSAHETIRLRVEPGAEGGARFSFQSGTYIDSTPTPDEIPPELTKELDAVHIAPVPFAQMEALIRWARPRARVLTVDPHYEHMDADWSRILPLVDAFLPSRAEVTAMLGGWPGAEQAVRQIEAPRVVVKLGSGGSIGRRGDEVVRLPATTPDPVDPTGCGDAFCGGHLVGLATSGELRTAMAHGAIAASFAGRDHGAGHALTVDRREAQRSADALLSRSRP